MSEFFLPAESAGAVDLLVRATILLCVGMVLQWLFRKWPAATRHRLWTLTFVLLLALPALRQFGPSWDLPLLPDANRPSDAARRLEVANSLVPADAGVTAAPLASLVLDVSFGRGGQQRRLCSGPGLCGCSCSGRLAARWRSLRSGSALGGSPDSFEPGNPWKMKPGSVSWTLYGSGCPFASKCASSWQWSP